MSDTVGLVGNSTILEPLAAEVVVGNGVPNLAVTDGDKKAAEAEKPLSVRDALSSEAKRLRDDDAAVKEEATAKGKEAADGAKDKVAEKEAAEKATAAEENASHARAQDGKFSKAEQEAATDPKAEAAKADTTAKTDPAKSRYAEPPARFLPEARTKWANVPNEIKAEMHRVEQERETEVQRYRTSHERYESIRQFDEIARTNGRDLRQSLEKVVQVENALRANPIAGLEMVIREMGPRKADGSPLSLYEVAQHIVQGGPQAYQQAMARAQQQAQPRQQAPQPNAEVEALRQEIFSMRAEQTVVPVVQQFAQQHEDFERLSPQIKTILDRGIIDDMYGPGLTHAQKLAEAYRMAGGNVSTRALQDDAEAPATTARLVNPDAGKKSIRGAPSNGVDTSSDDQDQDLRSMLRKEMRKMGV